MLTIIKNAFPGNGRGRFISFVSGSIPYGLKTTLGTRKAYINI